MKVPKYFWEWVGIVVILIVAITLIVWMMSRGTSSPWATTPGVTTSATPAPVFAPQGQLTPQFPKGLILDTKAAVGGSYAIDYSSSTNQYTTQYDSSSSVAVLYADYRAYFGSNGWTITNSSTITSASKIGALYATNASAGANVTIFTKPGGSEVTVSYVAQ